MKRSLTIFVCLLFFFGFLQQKGSFIQTRYEDVDDYMKARKRLIQAELALRFDAGITLSSQEKEASRKLMLLKQLAMNSLIYSAMEPEEKERALEFWRDKWEKFITWLNEYKF